MQMNMDKEELDRVEFRPSPHKIIEAHRLRLTRNARSARAIGR